MHDRYTSRSHTAAGFVAQRGPLEAVVLTSHLDVQVILGVPPRRPAGKPAAVAALPGIGSSAASIMKSRLLP
jgi:hypothetical protein